MFRSLFSPCSVGLSFHTDFSAPSLMFPLPLSELLRVDCLVDVAVAMAFFARRSLFESNPRCGIGTRLRRRLAGGESRVDVHCNRLVKGEGSSRPDSVASSEAEWFSETAISSTIS